MPDYLLDCPSCGKQNTVSSTSAGQKTACAACGSEIDIPKLRELKLLPQPDSTEASRGRARQSTRRAGLFAWGLGLAVIFGDAGGGLYWYSTKILSEVPDLDAIIEEDQRQIQSFTPSQVLENWDRAFSQNRTLPEWTPPSWKVAAKKARILQGTAYILMGLGAAGLLTSGFGLTRKPSR